jgi:isopenicillin N synthase-like dioxygenase
MEKILVSNLFNKPFENYVFPPEKRAGELIVDTKNMIPVIDLHLHGSHDDRTAIIQQILKASEEFGFFQVINHGIPEKLMDKTMSVVEEFFALSSEEKIKESSKEPKKRCKFYHSSLNYDTEEFHFWRDALAHPCNPVEEHSQYWPGKPSDYRETVGEYTVEVRKLGSRIMGLMSEGLKLETDELNGGKLTEAPVLLNNHYPPSPDPSLTIGIRKHRDPTLITILLQGDVEGLQVFKDDHWIGVDPIPHAFVINIGYILQIISNGKFKGAEHRVVTNSKVPRTTITVQVFPHDDCVIEPAKALINVDNPPRYRALKCKDFIAYYISKGADDEAVEEFTCHT